MLTCATGTKGIIQEVNLKMANKLGIKTLVAIPGIGRASQAPDPNYNSEHFKYSKENDTYTCPEGNILKSNGSTYKARNYHFKQYKTKTCKNCPVRALCTTSKVNGKVVQRSEYHQYIEDNAQSVLQNPNAYKKRQAIVEHPYGTIKRHWSFDHIMTKKTMQRASADVGFMFIAYNLTRIWNIIRKTNISIFYPNMTCIKLIKAILRHLKVHFQQNLKSKILALN